MAVYSFRTGPYARNIYLYGTQKFTDIPAEYVEPVKQYAATNYTNVQITEALNSVFITQQEYDDTLAYKVV